MTRALIVLFAAVTGACSPGPLPDIAGKAAEDPGADRFPADAYDAFPLDKAILANRFEEARRLLEQGENPNRRWQEGDRFPLQAVIDGGSYQVTNPAEWVRLLLKHGADPNARWCPFETRGREFGPGCTAPRSTTPLIFAAALGSTKIVELLLDAGADPSTRDWANGSALDYAHSEVMFELISRKLFPDLETRDQRALQWLREYEGFHYFAEASESTPLSRALEPSSLIFLTPLPPSPLGEEAELTNGMEGVALDRVRIVLRIGADPNERATRAGADWTPLGMAVTFGRLRVARELLQNGADPDQRWCARFEVASPTRPDYAATKDDRCTLQNGMTPLMSSAEAGNIKAVELLLEFNADRSLKDWAGRSALDHTKDRAVRNLLSERR